jgi:3-phytase
MKSHKLKTLRSFFSNLICPVIVAHLFFVRIVLAQVSPIVETSPVHSSGDAADDLCIWIHPTNTGLSTIIGTDKQSGLMVYDLNGNEIQYLTDGQMNNVDIRYNFPLGSESVAIVAASDRLNNSIAFYKVNPSSRELENIYAGTLFSGLTVYGLCLYHSPISDKYYCFVNSNQGEVEQWEIYDNGSGLVTGILVRSFDVGDQVEGCVTDDALANLYIGEEDVGIWKYGAEPGDGATRRLVDSTSPEGNLTADVEGLTIYYVDISIKYLIASSQGSNNFVIYDLGEIIPIF